MSLHRDLIKVLKALASKGSHISRQDRSSPWFLHTGQSTAGRVIDAKIADELFSHECLTAVSEGFYKLSETGRKKLKRWLSGAEGIRDQHRTMGTSRNEADGRGVSCTVNLSESPLAWLASRKDRKGRMLLDTAQVKAGERLRSDYSFACLMPAYGSSWRVEPGSGSSGASGSIVELSDDVFAARQRIDRILSAIEPALAALLIDVCCHLKGLETVEAERGWPARSAKVVLQIALSSLADRYGYAVTRGPEHSRTRNWQRG